MSVPTSGIYVVNNSGSAMTIAGQTLQNSGTFTFSASIAAQVCADVQFRMGYMLGTISVAISGNQLPTSPIDVPNDIFNQIVAGDITVT